jgi:hypothetical protein
LDITGIGKKLKTVLEGYATFLRKRKSVLPKYQQHLRVCRMIAAPLGISGHLLIDPFVGDNHLFSSEQPPQNAG